MAFLDSKEQVFDVQLTQHGKRLLMEGKFIPKYYSFGDEEIIYDSLCFGVSSSQNDISDRIKDNPQLAINYNFGVETDFNIYKKLVKYGIKEDNFVKEEERFFVYPIGNSECENDYFPAIKISFLENKISGSVSYLSSSVYTHVRIPQIDVDLNYQVYIGSIYEDNGTNTEKSYNDGSYIGLKENYVLLDLEEVNSLFENENFDIEVFEEKKDIVDSNKKHLIPFSFVTVEEKKDIYELPEKIKKNIDLSSSDVEYYLDILVDDEIDDEIMCKAKVKGQTKNIFVPDEQKNCLNKQAYENIYKKEQDEPEEDCEF